MSVGMRRSRSASKLSSPSSKSDARDASSLDGIAWVPDASARAPRVIWCLLDYLLAALGATLVFVLLRLVFRFDWYSAACASALSAAALLSVPLFFSPLGYDELLSAEAAVIQSAGVPIRADWAAFSTQNVPLWRIHSLCVVGDAGVKESRRREGKPPLPPLVLIHGHSGGAAHWETILAGASRAGVDAWAISLPGWGRSPSPPAFSLSTAAAARMSATTFGCESAQRQHQRASAAAHAASLMVEGLIGWLKARQLYGRAAVAGHSLGGFFAATMAGTDPHAAARFILASPAGLHPVAPGRESVQSAWALIVAPPQRCARWGGRIGAHFLAATIRRLFPDENPAYPPFYAQLAWAAGDVRVGSVGGGSDFVRVLLAYDFSKDAGWWAAPAIGGLLTRAAAAKVSLIWGTRDTVNEPAVGSLLHRVRAGVDVYWIAEGLHNAAHSHPKLFTAAILHALESQADGSFSRPPTKIKPKEALHDVLHHLAAIGEAHAAIPFAHGQQQRVATGAFDALPQHSLPPPRRPLCDDCYKVLDVDHTGWACHCGKWTHYCTSLFSAEKGAENWNRYRAFLDQAALSHPLPFRASSSRELAVLKCEEDWASSTKAGAGTGLLGREGGARGGAGDIGTQHLERGRIWIVR